MSVVRVALIALLATLVSACQSAATVKLYDGPERAAAELVMVKVPEQIELMTLDGAQIKGASTLFSGGTRELALSPGRHEILAYYKELWDSTIESHVIFRSAPVYFIVDGRAGDRFELGFAAPRSRDDAEALSEDFRGWSLNLASGVKTPTRASGIARPNLISNLISNDSTPAAAAPVAAPAAPRGSYLDELKRFWSEATPDERRAFRDYIGQ